MPINTGTESSTIRIDLTGAVTALFGVCSHGQGLEIVALPRSLPTSWEASFEDIEIVQGDSAAFWRTALAAMRAAAPCWRGGAGDARRPGRAVRDKIVRVAAHPLRGVDASISTRRTGASSSRARTTDDLPSELARAVYLGNRPAAQASFKKILEATKPWRS